MTEHYDAIVVGMGPGGEVAASRLLGSGRHVAIVEQELIGGECAYWACIPSKTLLRPLEARAAAGRAAGLGDPSLDWPALRDYRDYMIRRLDDTAQADGYRKQGATVVRGTARLAGPGRVLADGRELTADHVILATGSEPVRPPVEGLDRVPVWTNREATTLTEIPRRAVLIGGSAVGVELGQFLSRMGTRVTIIQRAERLLDREDPRLGESVAGHLAAEGIELRLGTQARSARRRGGETVIELSDGTTVSTDVVVLGTGRRPRTGGLGLETMGIRPGPHGELPIDEHGRLADGLWALGDVTGIAMFTHVAKYQARIVTDAILGRPRAADYTAVPRVVFADPEIAAVGLTEAQARRGGITTARAELDLPRAIARPWTYETDPRGTLALLADADRHTLIGAWTVAPQAGEWIHTAALAIRHRIPVSALADTIAQFPTYTEALTQTAGRLARDLRPR
ncbi:NAD(P)/FAD-dependent oxidoreductase [Streptomyces sp. YIM 98790]|uniref:dihydrolipoyl dehydrogenase family protein n=1 Tax=Streptomyces sp. YIM 98790 TaxID=2689077 RepID=UPI00140B8503|nr:NAD(P)/FAD-dependent oxidoreductase [Streptomyces sp. YIM 98790]